MDPQFITRTELALADERRRADVVPRLDVPAQAGASKQRLRAWLGRWRIRYIRGGDTACMSGGAGSPPASERLLGPERP